MDAKLSDLIRKHKADPGAVPLYAVERAIIQSGLDPDGRWDSLLAQLRPLVARGSRVIPELRQLEIRGETGTVWASYSLNYWYGQISFHIAQDSVCNYAFHFPRAQAFVTYGSDAFYEEQSLVRHNDRSNRDWFRKQMNAAANQIRVMMKPITDQFLSMSLLPDSRRIRTPTPLPESNKLWANLLEAGDDDLRASRKAFRKMPGDIETRSKLRQNNIRRNYSSEFRFVEDYKHIKKMAAENGLEAIKFSWPGNQVDIIMHALGPSGPYVATEPPSLLSRDGSRIRTSLPEGYYDHYRIRITSNNRSHLPLPDTLVAPHLHRRNRKYSDQAEGHLGYVHLYYPTLIGMEHGYGTEYFAQGRKHTMIHDFAEELEVWLRSQGKVRSE